MQKSRSFNVNNSKTLLLGNIQYKTVINTQCYIIRYHNFQISFGDVEVFMFCILRKIYIYKSILNLNKRIYLTKAKTWQ